MSAPDNLRSWATAALVDAEDSGHPEHGMKLALVGIGYAILDLASAVREKGAKDGDTD